MGVWLQIHSEPLCHGLQCCCDDCELHQNTLSAKAPHCKKTEANMSLQPYPKSLCSHYTVVTATATDPCSLDHWKPILVTQEDSAQVYTCMTALTHNLSPCTLQTSTCRPTHWCVLLLVKFILLDSEMVALVHRQQQQQSYKSKETWNQLRKTIIQQQMEFTLYLKRNFK